MRIKKLLLFMCVALIALTSQAKKYKYVFAPPFEIEQVRVGQPGTKFIQSWAIEKNADKAIILAKENAVAAALFTGIAPNQVLGAGAVPPLFSQGPTAYEQNKDFFDKFFQDGEFLKYVNNVNSTYPTGQNNIQTPNGRRVGIYLLILYDDLRNFLIEKGLIKAMGNQLRF